MRPYCRKRLRADRETSTKAWQARLPFSVARPAWLAQPELMLRTPDAVVRSTEMTVIAAGPGMGKDERAKRALRQALESPSTLLLDADALNLLSDDPELAEIAARRQAATLLTPHPAEAGLLLGRSTRCSRASGCTAPPAMQ